MRKIIMQCDHKPDIIDSYNRYGCSKCNCWNVKEDEVIEQRERDRRKYSNYLTNLGG